MTGRPIVAFVFSLISFLFIVQVGNCQVTMAVTKSKLAIDKIESLVELRHFEQAKLEIEHLYATSSINGILSDAERENLQYLFVVSGLSQGNYSAAQEAMVFLKKTSSKPLSAKLAFALAQYFFDLSRWDDALVYLEQTDALFLSNEQNERVQFQKGVAYFSQKKFDNASPYFKSLYQLKTSIYKEEVTYYLGFLSFAEKKYKEALQFFSALLESSKYRAVAPFYLSFIHHELGDNNAAIRNGELYLKGGDQLHQNEILQLLGSLYFNAGNTVKSVDVYEQLLTKGIQLTNVQHFELGTGYFLQAKYNKAIQQLNPLSNRKDVTGLNAMYVLAQCYLSVNQKSNARNSFSYCITGKIEEPKLESSLFNFAKLSFELGFEDQAINGLYSFIQTYPASKFLSEANEIMFTHYAKTNNFKQAINFLNTSQLSAKVDPSMKARVFFGRGMELVNDLDYKQADQMMASAAQQKDKIYFGPSVFWRGELAYRNEQYDQAITYLTTYLNTAAQPVGEATEANALYSLGYAYFEKEEYKKALTSFEKIRFSVNDVSPAIKKEVTLLSADCHFMLNNVPKAKTLYTSAYQAGGEGADYALFQLSLIEGIKSPSEKISLLKEAERKFPASAYKPLIFMELADTYLAEEQYTAAIPYLQRIPQLVDKDDEMIPDAMLKLGIAFYNADQPQQAIDKYRELIALYPSTQQAGEALASAKVVFVEKGKIEDYEEFLKNSGKSLTSLQKDSLRYEVVQNAVAAADVPLAKQAINQYLVEYPNGLFAIEVQHLLAELYVDEKDWLNAAKSYANLAERGASRYQEKALRQAAKLYFFELKDYSKSAVLFQQLANSSTKAEIILEALRGEVRSHYFLKQWMAGVRSSEQLMANSKANADDVSFAAIILGYFSQSNNEVGKAISSFQQVVNGNQSALAAEARYQLAALAVQQGNFNEGEVLANKTIELSGSNEYWITKAYILLGNIFFKQKDIFNAKATLTSVIDNCTIAELKTEAINLLKTVESSEKMDK